MSEALRLAGLRALDVALSLFEFDVIDFRIGSKDPRAPASLAIINGIIRVNGWGDGTSYKGNGEPQWCGMFAGKCWKDAGLDPSWLARWFASTDRLVAWASYRPWNGHRNPRPRNGDERLLGHINRNEALPFDLREGDIVIVGNGSRAAGDHVTVFESIDQDARTITTISGNGGGVGPTGERRDFRGGISRATYQIDARTGYRPMFGIRPAFGDLLAERA
jgi:hypothetical protein